MAWWNSKRLKDGVFQPEPYWLYFELAQAHNALLLGELEPVWQVLDYRLANQDVPGLFGWREGGEGIGTNNATEGVTLIPLLRGCHRFDNITPHGWSHAEMWLLQRAVLVEDWRDGLLLFAGVPAKWLQPNNEISFRDFPTSHGTVSARLTVSPDGTFAHISIEGAAPVTPLHIVVRGRRVEASASALPMNFAIDLT
jgi:hypothetical protein